MANDAKSTTESVQEQLGRVQSMASGAETWDLSENDCAALKTVLAQRGQLLAAAKAALAYDAAIEERARNGAHKSAPDGSPFEGLPGAVAEGPDLDALYADWQTKAAAAVAMAEAR